MDWDVLPMGPIREVIRRPRLGSRDCPSLGIRSFRVWRDCWEIFEFWSFRVLQKQSNSETSFGVLFLDLHSSDRLDEILLKVFCRIFQSSEFKSALIS